MPTISVILPVFNAAPFVSASVGSILSQTVRDLELIVIDDGSSDASHDEVLRTIGTDPRVTVVSRENRGLVASLNEGIDRAQSPWIARMDADDVALPTRLECQIAHLKQARASFCGTWAKSMGAGRSRILRHPASDAAIKTELLFGSCFIHPTVTMASSALRSLRYRSEMTYCEDYDLWERAASAGHTMTNVSEVLLRYRLHPRQESKRHQAQQGELARTVSRRAWTSFLSLHGEDVGLANDVAAVRAPGLSVHDLDRIDRTFRLLLSSTCDEARSVALDHIRRLYFRLAGRHRCVPQRWAALMAEFGGRSSKGADWAMTLVSALRLHPEQPVFQRAKHWYSSWLR